MNPAPRRVPPVVIAAFVNILLFATALALGAVSILPGLAANTASSAPALQASSEDPPPLTPILDPNPDPQQPLPVQQVVGVVPAAETLASAAAAEPPGTNQGW